MEFSKNKENILGNVNTTKKISLYFFMFFVILAIIYIFFKISNKNTVAYENKLIQENLVTLESYNEKLSHPEEDDIFNQIITANGGKEEIEKQEVYDPKSTNLTDLIARDMFIAGKYSANDPTIDPELLSNTITNALTSYTKPKIENDFKISTDNTATYLRAYGGAMGNLAIFYTTTVDSVSKLLIEYLENEDQDKLDRISKISDKFKEVCDYYKNNVTVPGDMIDTHKKLMLSCSSFYSAFAGLSDQKKDPVKAIISLQALNEEQQNVIAILKDYDKYFKAKNIIYKKEEIGSVFSVVSNTN